MAKPHPPLSILNAVLVVALTATIGCSVWAQSNGEVMVPEATHFARPFNSPPLSPNNTANNSSVKIQYIDVNGQPVLVQFTYVGPPKILPIATADSYPEGSLINLICTVSGGQRRGLKFSWTKNNVELDAQKMRNLAGFENVHLGEDDPDISVLKIRNATGINSGNYTCTARNAFGHDSTSVKIVINVELKWAQAPKDTEVGLNQDLSIECDATGAPEPTIEWRRHPALGHSNVTTLVARGKLLKILRAQMKDAGLYECNARNGVDVDLRRVIQVKVRDGN